MYSNKYSSPLGDKLQNREESQISLNLCAWSDLLGFGSHFTKTNWNLSKKDWLKITDRLDEFYKIHSRYFSPSNSYMFVLNDGVIKTYFIENDFANKSINILHGIELWLRHIVMSHIFIMKSEISNNFPGARTVIAFGEKAEYTFSEARIDDFVLNYTRPKGGFSNIAKGTGNPIIISNPKELQMNTALAKAYILDDMGSKKGIGGSSLYIDESVLNFITELVKMSNIININESDTEEGKLISFEYIEKFERPWLFGLLIDKEINIDEDIIKTNVYKIKAYYPNDEHPEEFRFEL
ncbi:hypothetical protein KJ870_05490 [bacterium]|nr:hypothetical protein [bacterium]MBU1434372.1 hypothetical protein [bacterium]MBU1501950.1 hypothetical protein [bacterium]